jgi:hypothetical protein
MFAVDGQSEYQVQFHQEVNGRLGSEAPARCCSGSHASASERVAGS